MAGTQQLNFERSCKNLPDELFVLMKKTAHLSRCLDDPDKRQDDHLAKYITSLRHLRDRAKFHGQKSRERDGVENMMLHRLVKSCDEIIKNVM